MRPQADIDRDFIIAMKGEYRQYREERERLNQGENDVPKNPATQARDSAQKSLTAAQKARHKAAKELAELRRLDDSEAAVRDKDRRDNERKLGL